jgi:hypothetical protein
MNFVLEFQNLKNASYEWASSLALASDIESLCSPPEQFSLFSTPEYCNSSEIRHTTQARFFFPLLLLQVYTLGVLWLRYRI